MSFPPISPLISFLQAEVGKISIFSWETEGISLELDVPSLQEHLLSNSKCKHTGRLQFI